MPAPFSPKVIYTTSGKKSRLIRDATPPPVSRTGSVENPVFRNLRSELRSFPMDLLKAIVSSSNPDESHPVVQSIEHAGVALCVSFIGRNPGLKLCDLMKISGLSRRGLTMAFITHLGCTPGTVLIMMRLWSACDLLANSRLPVPKIATCCGYRNLNSLYVAFQRYLGITPCQVRKRTLIASAGLSSVDQNISKLSSVAVTPACANSIVRQVRKPIDVFLPYK
jgi:AraC-like DNA-binding protein